LYPSLPVLLAQYAVSTFFFFYFSNTKNHAVVKSWQLCSMLTIIPFIRKLVLQKGPHFSLSYHLPCPC
ncbi:hypothetical protein GOODEAATRI_016026, partial [Goodea atripinnis]